MTNFVFRAIVGIVRFAISLFMLMVILFVVLLALRYVLVAVQHVERLSAQRYEEILNNKPRVELLSELDKKAAALHIKELQDTIQRVKDIDPPSGKLGCFGNEEEPHCQELIKNLAAQGIVFV
jgi:hypothetical protein